jgi:hypothetical protein
VLVVYAAMAAGGLVLLATRRLTRPRAPRRDPLSPGVTASCFLVASALVWIFGFVLRSAPAPPQGPTGPCSFVCHFGSGPVPGSGPGPSAGPVLMVLVIYAAMAAAGLVLLVARRLTGHRAPRRDPLSPGVTAGCFLMASALLGLFGFLLRSAPAVPPGPTGPCSFVCNVSSGPAPASGPVPAGPVLTVLVVYVAMAAGGLVLLAARRLTGHGTPRRDRLSPGTTAICFLLASAPLLALIVRFIVGGVAVPIAPAQTESWETPLSAGSVSAAPLVSGAVVAGCLAVAVGYGLQAALRRTRRRPRSGAVSRILGQADRGGAGRAYV